MKRKSCCSAIVDSKTYSYHPSNTLPLHARQTMMSSTAVQPPRSSMSDVILEDISQEFIQRGTSLLSHQQGRHQGKHFTRTFNQLSLLHFKEEEQQASIELLKEHTNYDHADLFSPNQSILNSVSKYSSKKERLVDLTLPNTPPPPPQRQSPHDEVVHGAAKGSRIRAPFIGEERCIREASRARQSQ